MIIFRSTHSTSFTCQWDHCFRFSLLVNRLLLSLLVGHLVPTYFYTLVIDARVYPLLLSNFSNLSFSPSASSPKFSNVLCSNTVRLGVAAAAIGKRNGESTYDNEECFHVYAPLNGKSFGCTALDTSTNLDYNQRNGGISE